MSRRLLAILLLAALLGGPPQAAVARSAAVEPLRPTAVAAAGVSLRRLVGQKLMVAMSGTSASPGLLARIAAGEVGGVILFRGNIASPAQLGTLTAQLRAAAADGGQPPLLIATDQEGGLVRRVTWAPPTASAAQLGAGGSSASIRDQGEATATMLACAGVNGDLAPVADVPSSTSSFLYLQGRTWSFDASATSDLANAFASGLASGDVVPAMKHFPGLGRALQNTDTDVVTIKAARSVLADGLAPYQTAIRQGVPMIMLANATYTAYDPQNAAGWSHAISVDLLRGRMGFDGVTITDSLSGTAAARGVSAAWLAVRAARAGTDMILVTGSERSSDAAYDRLLTAARNGFIGRDVLQASYDRILALKATLAAPLADGTPPVVRAPVSRLIAVGRLGATGVRIHTAWSSVDPCGAAATALKRQQDAGAWTRRNLPGAATRSVEEGLAFDDAWRYRVTVTDGAGNSSRGVAGAAFRPMRVQESGDGIHLRGDWRQAANRWSSGGALATTTRAGARARYTFVGSSVAWVAYRGPTRGSAALYLDGVYRTTVDLHATKLTSRAIVYAKHWKASGTHTLTIVNLGTPGHARIDVDAFVRLAPA